MFSGFYFFPPNLSWAFFFEMEISAFCDLIVILLIWGLVLIFLDSLVGLSKIEVGDSTCWSPALDGASVDMIFIEARLPRRLA